MPTSQKAEIIKSVQKNFEESAGIYFTNYKGMTVSQACDIRDKFREKDILFHITKNTLTRIAAKNAGYDNIDHFFSGQIGIAYAKDDPGEPARIIKEFIKNGGTLEVVGAIIEGQSFGADKFDELAKLPTRIELIAKFVGGLSQPMTKLVSTLNGAMSKFTRTLESLKQTKE